MKRHALSALGIAVAVILGWGTSRPLIELDVELARSEDALIVTNANDFTWTDVEVFVGDYEQSDNPSRLWRAASPELPPGESLRIPFAELKNESGAFTLPRDRDALVRVFADSSKGKSIPVKGQRLSEIPLVGESAGEIPQGAGVRE